MEKEIPKNFQPQGDQSVDRNKHLADTLKEIALADYKRIRDLEGLRVSESEDGSNRVFGNALKKNEEDYKDKLRAANVTIIQLKRRLQEVEEQKNEQLTTTKRLMQEKFESYEKELEESNKTIKWLEDQVVKAKGVDVEEVTKLKENLFQSEMDVSRKINEITELKTQLNEARQTSEEASKLRSKLHNALEECNRISAELQVKNVEYTEVKTKLSSLEQQLLETQQQALEDMQEALNREKQVKLENLKAKDRINELEQELQRTQNNLNLKAQQLLAQQSDTAELTYVRQQLGQSQSALNKAVKSLADANRELERLKLKEDELLALKAQVESYKSDFNAERQSLQNEKERNQKMSEELQQLRDSNKLLQEEVDVLRREMYGPGRAPQTCAPSTCYMPPPPLYHGYYTCPKCHNTFHNFSQRDAEYHVYHCMI